MGGTNIGDAVSDAANAVMDGVNAVSPLIDHILDPLDILPDSIRIPGTDLYVSLGSFLLGPLIGLPFIPFKRRDDGGNTLATIAPSNPYYADLKIFVNDVAQENIAFITPGGFSSSFEVTKYFKENASNNYIELCSTYPNSTITLLFNDVDFDNNDGAINVSICYLGENESCNGTNDQEDETNSIAVGFTRIDANMAYPVSCHGMVYVGDNNEGLSTGGRCEIDTIFNAESKINEKYFNKYSTSFDDTENATELEKARVLDLVYKYNGSSWIRQQNLIESVYYHCGVGNAKHSLFFGGIHETIAKYTFSYNNDIGSLPIPEFSDFNFDNKQIYSILEDKLYGQQYPNSLNNSACWVEPAWKFDSNFNIPPERVDNPLYSPSPSAEYLGFIRDADFPFVKFLSIEPNGSFQFGLTETMLKTSNSCSWGNGGHIFGGINITSCDVFVTEESITSSEVISGSSLKFTYPTVDTLQVSANFSTAIKNIFIVKAGTQTISGTQVLFKGGVEISTVELEYPHKVFIYPSDVSSGTITNETGGFSLKSINSNSENINLVGAFQHSFDYTSTNGGISGYVNRGLWTLTFNSLNNIKDGILNRTTVEAIQNFTVLDSSMFPISGTYVTGNGKVLFDIIDRNGIMIGVENKNYIWNDSLENSTFNIAEKLNIIGTIGNNINERWGTPLWASSFTNSTDYTGLYLFNSRIDTANSNEGNSLYEITDLELSSNSLMALTNNRILVTGNTLSQNHKYTSLNNIKILGKWGVNTITYTPNFLGNLYTQTVGLTSTGVCVDTYVPSSAMSTVIGNMTSIGAVCCSGIHNYPSNLFLLHADTNPISASDGSWSINMKYDYIDECAWKIDNSVYTPGISGQIYDFTYTTNCIYSCPNTTIESLLSGTVTSSGKQFNFPSDNFVATVVPSSSILVGGTYSRTVVYDLLDDNFWKVHNVQFSEYLPLIGCTLTISNNISDFTNGKYSYSTSPVAAVSASVSGSILSLGSNCCSGMKLFPKDFTYTSTTLEVSGTDLFAFVDYKLYNDCTIDPQALVRVILSAKHTGQLTTMLKACSVGEVNFNIKTCEVICDQTITHNNTANIDIGSDGTSYTEYATNFIQEYRDDSRYKVPEYWVTSNANDIITPNKGIMVASNWKRYMDGVGLGGDTPDYDTIYNTKTKQTYQLSNWKEIGHWNVGQMAFGNTDKVIVVGGHKVSSEIGNSLIGSGMHSTLTSKRVYIWDVSVIPQEDSYLKNYYGRRFNTFYSTATLPISSNQNKSDMSIIIYNAESDIVIERFGTVTFDGTKNNIDVKFDKEMPDDVDVKYCIAMTCGDNVKVWWENKTKQGFTLKSEIEKWAGTVDYTATAIIKTTEQDIVNNPPENGYIFSK